MFDFIFKRTTQPTPSGQASAASSSADKQSQQASKQAKQAALEQAASLANNESAAVEFILQCQFADARLKAAGHLSSRDMLERVFQAMRNTDRRVSKLVQSRLQEYAHLATNEKAAQQSLELAQRLLQEQQLAPNLVADLDRSWQLIAQVPEQLLQQFVQVRTELRRRLENQAALQRAVMDVLVQMNRLLEDSSVVLAAEGERALALLEQAMERHASELEAHSVPKHLFTEFTQKALKYKQHLTALVQDAGAIAARQDALSRWEAALLNSLKPETLKREWKALPALKNDALTTAMQERFDAILNQLIEVQKSLVSTVKETRQVSLQHVIELLANLDQALQDGSLQLASEADKALRAVDFKALKLSEPLSAQMAKARAELVRLQGWAKWGGNVSREELLKAAEGLPTQSLAVMELAKKVGSLRERWKSLDVSAGTASQDLWHRFDAACTTAYAPAAEHFKKLAEERQHNGEKARALIDEVRKFATNANLAVADAVVDWKALAGLCAKLPLQWQKLGTIDRKAKKQLDTEFNAALQELLSPLAEQRALETKRREKLIAEAADLNPHDRNAIDQVRALQERWQAQAKSLPLEHKEEQALWQRFREQCDQVFAKRKEMASAADADRKENAKAKAMLCEQLEGAVNTTDKEMAKALREVKESWGKTGPVPRADEDKLEKRYKDAVICLQKKLDQSRRDAAEAEFIALNRKLTLCRAIEQALADGVVIEPDKLEVYRSDWQNLPSLRAEFERKVKDRFTAGIKALQENDRQFAVELSKNAAQLAQQVLRCEILMGVDSPAELARERLKLQVDVLQSSLKNGADASTPQVLSAHIANLIGMHAQSEPQMSARLDQLIEHFKRAA